MDPLLASPWAGVATYTGLAALVVLSVIRGWLIPRSSHEREIAHYEARIVELKATNELVDARNDMLAEQIRMLTDGLRTANAALSALPVVTHSGVVAHEGA